MEGENQTNYKEEAVKRVSAIRFRTWSLTLVIFIALIFYFLMQTIFKESINIIDFFFLCVTSILIHCIYFPDGELFGQRNKKFNQNKDAYNAKANSVNRLKIYNKLKEYCEYEFEQRVKSYKETQMAQIGVTEEEFAWFTEQSKKFILQNTKFEINGKLFILDKHKRKRLIKLLFKPLPIEKNEPQTIMSAMETHSSKKITDSSVRFKKSSYISKVLISIVMGLVFAYVGYTFRDGISFEQITVFFMFIATIMSTAVTSFSSGEICQRVYRSQFYVEISLFLDGFAEWCGVSLDEEKRE